MNASKKEQQESRMERQFRNGTAIKGTAVNGTTVKKLSLARSTLPILGTHLHTKRKAIVYTSLQLNQMEQQIIKDRKRQSYVHDLQ